MQRLARIWDSKVSQIWAATLLSGPIVNISGQILEINDLVLDPGGPNSDLEVSIVRSSVNRITNAVILRLSN
jgi:hypothetical protein